MGIKNVTSVINHFLPISDKSMLSMYAGMNSKSKILLILPKHYQMTSRNKKRAYSFMTNRFYFKVLYMHVCYQKQIIKLQHGSQNTCNFTL